jgi:SAM-dependent methyltransferase
VPSRERRTALISTTGNCPACGARDIVSEIAVPDHEYGVDHVARYATCSGCASLYQRPMPGTDELASFYPPDYHSMTGQGALDRVRDDMRLRRLRAIGGAGGPVLDYGCGNGDFLVRAAHRWPGQGYFGYEISSHPETVVLADGAVTVVRGDLETMLAAVPPCRLITMNHVVEHLPDPSRVLALLRDKLLPGGVVEGQTPAAGSFEHRVFGPRWSGFHAPRHTVVFTPDGLSKVLSRSGFVDVRVERAFNPAAIAVSLASLPHRGKGGRIHRSGPGWLALVALAGACAPVDLLSGRPGIVNFAARRQ